MAAAASVTVDCPAGCGAELEVPIALTSSFAEGCRFILRVEPDKTKVADHLALEHS